MADVVFSLGARDETGPAARGMANNFRSAARRGQASLRQLGRAGQAAFRVVRQAALAAGAAVGAVGAAYALQLRSAVESATELERFNRLTGVNIETLQTWRAVLSDLDGDLGDVQGALSGMHDFLQEVADGNEQAQRTLALLGLEFAALQAQSPESQLAAIFRGLNSIEEAGSRAALAHRIMGEDFEKLNVIFSRSQEELDQLAARTNYLSAENLRTAAVIRSATADIGTSFHSLTLSIAQNLIDYAAQADLANNRVVQAFDVAFNVIQDRQVSFGALAASYWEYWVNAREVQLRRFAASVQRIFQDAVLAAVELLNRLPGLDIDTAGLRTRQAASRDVLRQATLDAAGRRDDASRRHNATLDRLGTATPLQNLIRGLQEDVRRQLAAPPLEVLARGPRQFLDSTIPEAPDPAGSEDLAEPRARVPGRARRGLPAGGRSGPQSVENQRFEFTFNFYGDVERDGLEERLITNIQRALDRGLIRVAT